MTSIINRFAALATLLFLASALFAQTETGQILAQYSILPAPP